jgi:hypothetical protein
MAEGGIRNSRFLALLLKYFARAHIWVYRRTDGRLGGRLLWFPAALVTTIGRKSGLPHTTAADPDVPAVQGIPQSYRSGYPASGV